MEDIRRWRNCEAGVGASLVLLPSRGWNEKAGVGGQQVFYATRERAPRAQQWLPAWLLLYEAGVAGYAQPLALLEDPGVGEAAEVFVGLGGVHALDVIVAGDDGGVGIHFDFNVVDVHETRFEFWVSEVGEKFAAVADLAVVFGVDETVADHAGDSLGVETHLRLVPHALERDDVGGVRGRVGGLSLGGLSPGGLSQGGLEGAERDGEAADPGFHLVGDTGAEAGAE